MRRSRTGQTLVLFALTLLLMTLMVLMTISFGVRIHERTEQQLVADAAAYSQAVVTARAFNASAALNRVLIAEMSAIAAGQALLSWAGYYHGTLNQARDVLKEQILETAAQCDAVLATARLGITREDKRLIDIWEPLGGGYHGVLGHDVKAANFIRQIYETALTIADHQREVYGEMTARVAPASGPGIAEEIAERARQGSPWRIYRGELYAEKQDVSRRELDQAVEPLQRQPRHAVRAFMATRGVEQFISSREESRLAGGMSGAEYVQRRLQKVINRFGPSPLIVHVSNYGTAYYGDRGPMRTSGPAEYQGYDGQAINYSDWERWRDVGDDAQNPLFLGAWGQDVGRFYFEWPNPPPGCQLDDPTEDSFGYLVTTGPSDNRDNHMWRRGDPMVGDYRELDDPRVSDPPVVRHSFQVTPSPGNPPGLWPVFVDYRESALDGAGAAANVYGQPKMMVPILRDYAVRGAGDPWNLHFSFGFTAGAPGQEIDLRHRAAQGRAVALGSALTYYHRGGGHFREPPNFLNPFWRATLVASDVDEAYPVRGKDAEDTLRALGENTQADALLRLRQKGFEALP
jgi:hypothetical protein